MAPFVRGKNNLRVVATKGTTKVEDEINFVYQTEKWGTPTELRLSEVARSTVDGKQIITVEAKLYDSNNIMCLNAKDIVHFSVAGTGTLIDNRGTSRGSRIVQMYNGRAKISLTENGGVSVVGAEISGLKAAFCTLS